jgi:hypothetical protein
VVRSLTRKVNALVFINGIPLAWLVAYSEESIPHVREPQVGSLVVPWRRI